jgi:uroporphyrinogen decarboxylase
MGAVAIESTMSPKARFLAAARRLPVDRRPVWLMRQAGRYLPEYKKAKGSRAFMDVVRSAEIAAELTLQPLRRFPLDAAIIFCDILVPLSAMGLDVRFVEGSGPRLDPPVRTRADVDRLEPFDPEAKTGFLRDAIGLVARDLGALWPVIGFCGGPFTVAAYAVEGGGSRDFARTKALLQEDRATFDELLTRIVDATIPYMGMQVLAGCSAFQIFESWGGALDAATWHEVVHPHMERLVVCGKALGVPVIVYARDGAHLLDALAEAGPDVLGLGPDVDVGGAVARFGDRFALQGNLDPAVLAGPPATAVAAAERVLAAFAGARGHIFNVGAGITPDANPESVGAVVDAVRAWKVST